MVLLRRRDAPQPGQQARKIEIRNIRPDGAGAVNERQDFVAGLPRCADQGVRAATG